MKNLIVYAHPHTKSFCNSITKTLTQSLTPGTFMVRDLYALNFNPVFSANELKEFYEAKVSAETLKEQEYIKKAKTLTFIYPIWHAGPPAILKGYWDRILTRGFAYDFGRHGLMGLLKDKKAALIRTQGASKEDYESIYWPAMNVASSELMKKYGMEVIFNKYFPSVATVSEKVRAGYLEDVKEFAKMINV